MYNVNMSKILWKIQHISLSDRAKLMMLKSLGRNEDLPLIYRSWDLYELPQLPPTSRHIWSVKTTTQLTKPRYVIVAFQTNRNDIVTANASEFDHCNITNMKLFMNNQQYPYDSLDLNFTGGNYFQLLHMLIKIQTTYYGCSSDTKWLTDNNLFTLLAEKPVFAFDCSRSDERVKGGMVDVRIEMDASQNFPNNTKAFCLVIHDNLVWYSPFSGLVRREI